MIDLYQHIYGNELQRKDNFDQKIGTALLLLTLDISSIAFNLNTLNKRFADLSKIACDAIISAIFLILSIGLFLIALWFGYKAFYGRKYDYLDVESIGKGRALLKEFFINNIEMYQGRTVTDLTEDELKKQIQEKYLFGAQRNFFSNNSSIVYYKKYTYAITISLMFSGICGLLHYILQIF